MNENLEIQPENSCGEVRFLQRQSRVGMWNSEQTLTVHQTLGDHGYTAIELWNSPEQAADEDEDAAYHVGVFPDDLGELIIGLTNAFDAVSNIPFEKVQAVMKSVYRPDLKRYMTFPEAELYVWKALKGQE